MRKIRWEFLLVGLAALSLGASGCPLIPSIEEKVVELAVGGSTTAEFVADGVVNTHNDTKTVDLRTAVDIPGILDDAGIDLSDLVDIKLSGVSYRTTKPDPTATREIRNGQVTVRRGAGAETPLVTNFNVVVNSATSWQTATLDPAGVTVLNGLLNDMLVELQGGATATNTTITYHVTGDSFPGATPTDFVWELKADLSILGTVKIKTLK